MSFMEIGSETTFTVRMSEEKKNTLLIQLEDLDLEDKDHCDYILEFIELLKSER